MVHFKVFQNDHGKHVVIRGVAMVNCLCAVGDVVAILILEPLQGVLMGGTMGGGDRTVLLYCELLNFQDFRGGGGLPISEEAKIK